MAVNHGVLRTLGQRRADDQKFYSPACGDELPITVPQAERVAFKRELRHTPGSQGDATTRLRISLDTSSTARSTRTGNDQAARWRLVVARQTRWQSRSSRRRATAPTGARAKVAGTWCPTAMRDRNRRRHEDRLDVAGREPDRSVRATRQRSPGGVPRRRSTEATMPTVNGPTENSRGTSVVRLAG